MSRYFRRGQLVAISGKVAYNIDPQINMIAVRELIDDGCQSSLTTNYYYNYVAYGDSIPAVVNVYFGSTELERDRIEYDGDIVDVSIIDCHGERHRACVYCEYVNRDVESLDPEEIHEQPVLKVKKCIDDAIVPHYLTSGSAGMDLYAHNQVAVTLEAHQMHTFHTGVAIEIPPGYEAQVRPRSGLACNYGITVVNSPGTIDSDYRGEILVTLLNSGYSSAYTITYGMRIAQLVISRVNRLPIEVVTELSETERGIGGHGSTGK